MVRWLNKYCFEVLENMTAAQVLTTLSNLKPSGEWWLFGEGGNTEMATPSQVPSTTHGREDLPLLSVANANTDGRKPRSEHAYYPFRKLKEQLNGAATQHAIRKGRSKSSTCLPTL